MRWIVSAVALLALAGCSGGGDPAPAATTAAPGAGATIGVPSGTAAPEALSAFRCNAVKDKTWVAAGFVANDGKQPVTYQVTVYVGPADGQTRPGRTLEVPKVAAGGSSRFEITDIAAGGSTCHVQVLRTKG